MSETKPQARFENKEDDFASRAATYFVFIFLIAAIVETLLAGLLR
jgi:hypothetical protein